MEVAEDWFVQMIDDAVRAADLRRRERCSALSPEMRLLRADQLSAAVMDAWDDWLERIESAGGLDLAADTAPDASGPRWLEDRGQDN